MTPSTAQAEKARSFLDLHVPGRPLLMPNAWDIGSARLFANVGCEAIATTSGGFALTQGRLDGAMTGDEVLAHCAELSAAVDVPVSADLENCFADEPPGVAETIHRAIEQGLAGGSVEDFTRNSDDPIYELGLAADRVRAAAEAAHNGPVPFVLTARAENYLHGRVDLADTIARLQAYQEAGADVLFAPRVVDPGELQTLLAAVDRPVNVLLTPGAPPISALAALGVARISVGGAIAAAAYGTAIEAVKQLQIDGIPNYWEAAGAARADIAAAFVKP
ncbi:MAG TPA: isocitrate lyase/phosphoenolpyruvate mutase family protein [Acidimicrobiales bacterium]|jgi:2-methylisocitrate lyase-like PEP mutase family enzyme|nr:isocitrate lyase/phosphoenolpyruvate mutase family protein [Acidimicrobiales bacterium]